MEQREIALLAHLDGTQRCKVRGHELAIQQRSTATAQGGDQPGKCYLRCIRHTAEHAFAAEHPIEGHAVKPANKLPPIAARTVLPALDRMGVPAQMQLFITRLDAPADPAAAVIVVRQAVVVGFAIRRGGHARCRTFVHHLRKGFIAGHYKAVPTQGSRQRSGYAESVQRQNCPPPRLNPEYIRIVAAVCHRENPAAVSKHEQIGRDRIWSAWGMHRRFIADLCVGRTCSAPHKKYLGALAFRPCVAAHLHLEAPAPAGV